LEVSRVERDLEVILDFEWEKRKFVTVSSPPFP